MFTQWKKIIAILSAAALLSTGAKIALAQEHNHGHAHEAEKPAQLTLNNGKKWVTDDNLRQAMVRIRDALSAELPAIHSGKATAEQYRVLAQKTNDQIAFMVKNCKLDPKADTALHIVLTDIIAGTDAMLKPDVNEARKGAEKIASALDSYGTHFEHQGWHGVKMSH